MKNIFCSSKSEPAPEIVKIVTYKYNDKLVYVPLARSFDEALNIAYQNYPELSDVPRSRMSFTVGAKVGVQKMKARVSREVYAEFLPRFNTHEIMYITVLDQSLPPSPLPSPQVLVSDADVPPMYDADEKRRSEFLDVDAKSRPSSPGGQGRSRSRSPSSANVAARAFDWIETKMTKQH